ncbi:MAG: 1,4-dihydroxy-2-naphthoate polyprenyltransferase [Bdellovibrionia bacterium]
MTAPRASFTSRLKTWLMAARPKTLTAAIAPILVGTTLSHAAFYPSRWDLAIFALLSSLFIQIGTNLINDSIDFKKGTDTEERIGPKRVTQSGLLSPQTVMLGGFICFAISALLAVPLLLQGGWVIVGIGALSLLCGYAYTGGPFPLAYVGLGDLFVLLFFGLAAVGGVYYLNTGTFDLKPVVAGVQIGLLAMVMIAINNLRDAEGDKKTGKKTLAVRFGKAFSRAEITFLCLAPFAMGIYWFNLGLTAAAVAPLLVLPLAIRVVSKIQNTEPSPAYNAFLGMSALLHLLFGILLSAGFNLT